MEDVRSGGTVESFNQLSNNYLEWSKNLKKRFLGKDWLIKDVGRYVGKDITIDKLYLEAPGEDLPVELRDLLQEYISIDLVRFIIGDEGHNTVTIYSNPSQQESNFVLKFNYRPVGRELGLTMKILAIKDDQITEVAPGAFEQQERYFQDLSNFLKAHENDFKVTNLQQRDK